MENTKVGIVFSTYIHDLVHIMVHALIIVMFLKLAAISLDTIKSRLRLIVTIPRIV